MKKENVFIIFRQNNLEENVDERSESKFSDYIPYAAMALAERICKQQAYVCLQFLLRAVAESKRRIYDYIPRSERALDRISIFVFNS